MPSLEMQGHRTFCRGFAVPRPFSHLLHKLVIPVAFTS